MCKSLCPLATPMDEPSYENEEPKIRAIDVIDQEQPPSTAFIPQHCSRRRSSHSPPVDSVQLPAVADDGDQNYYYDDDGQISVDKRLSPDGASNNNADEPSDDKLQTRIGVDDRLSGLTNLENGKTETVTDSSHSLQSVPVKNASKLSVRETPDGADDDDSNRRSRDIEKEDLDAPYLNGEAWVEDDPRPTDVRPAVIVTAADADAVVDATSSAHPVDENKGPESEAGDQQTPIFGLGTDDSQQSLTNEFNGLDLYDNDDK